MKGRRYRLFGFSQAGSFFGDTGFKIFSASRFANATNETVYPVQWKNCPESEVTAIYGYSFDGLNDYVALSTINTYSGDFWIEIDLFLNTTQSSNGALFGSNATNKFRVRSYDFVQIQNPSGIATIGDITDFFTSLPDDKLVTLRVERVGSNITMSSSENGYSTTVIWNTADLVVDRLMARGNGTEPYSGGLFEFRDSLGNIYNDSNNLGGTISGATRYVSNDGGDTWTPA